MSKKYNPGMKIRNFEVKRVVPLEEIQTTLIECEHLPTGAHVIKLLNEDEENLFSLSFQTLPSTSNGVAHILEHTVLCGSHRFPIKDPFFCMIRRSLNTYMNALTGNDFTCYPAATLVPKDFYNLLEIYLDAVFHPLLKELSFLQEGHRIEFQEMDDPTSPLIYKGIVYNEMKGAMATKEARLSEALTEALFPDLTYSVNSGGDPKEITQLTYEELKAFHQYFYHPSRCLFFFYGNLPLEEQLAFIEEKELAGVQKAPPLPPLSKQKRFTERKKSIKEYPVNEEELEEEQKALVALGYLTCSILEQEELLGLLICDILLAATDAAPLKMALLKSGLCKEADTHIDVEISEIPFFIICKGCPEGAGNKIEAVIEKSLKQIIEQGFAQELIEGAIHQLEMSRSEITGGSTPYGLSLFFRSALLKQHGGLPEDGLRIHSLFNKLRQKKPEYFTQLIEKHLLKNPHSVLLEMVPSSTLPKKEQEEEAAKLTTIRASLTESDLKNVVKKSHELARFQDKKDPLDLLPKVTLADVKREATDFLLINHQVQKLKVSSHICFTNQIFYTDLIFDLPKLDLDEIVDLRLLCNLLPQIGSGGRNYQEHLDYLLKHTGGVSAFLDFSGLASDPNTLNPFLCIRSKALNRKAPYLFSLLKEIASTPDLTDEERIAECLMQHLNALESSIQHSPLRYGVQLAASHFSMASAIQNRCWGLPYYWKLKEIVQEFAKKPKGLIDRLMRVKEKTLGLQNAHLILSVDETMHSQLQKEEYYGIASICTKSAIPWKNDFSKEQVAIQARIISAPVAFTTLLFDSVAYNHPDHAALGVASEIMENETLHPRIREQGGAYGSGAALLPLSGYFYFYTYRDPHLAASLKAMKEAVDKMCKKTASLEEIESAKLQIFQDLDTPTPPCARAYTAYMRHRSGRTLQVRQALRDQLIALGPTDIQEASKRHLKEGLKRACLVTFINKELLEKEKSHLKEKIEEFTIDDQRFC